MTANLSTTRLALDSYELRNVSRALIQNTLHSRYVQFPSTPASSGELLHLVAISSPLSACSGELRTCVRARCSRFWRTRGRSSPGRQRAKSRTKDPRRNSPCLPPHRTHGSPGRARARPTARQGARRPQRADCGPRAHHLQANDPDYLRKKRVKARGLVLPARI